MRRWFCYILESYDENFPRGSALIYKEPSVYCSKNEVRDMILMNINTGEQRVVAKVVGLGYADFKDEKDFAVRLGDVIKKKLEDCGVEAVCVTGGE